MSEGLLNTAEMIADLKAHGAPVSRDTFDKMRKDGDVPFHPAKGRFKFLFNPRVVRPVFIGEETQECSANIDGPDHQSGIVGELTSASAFERARALAKQAKPRR